MGERDDLRTIHKVYEAFGQGDVGGVISMLADEVAGYFEGYEDSAAVVAAFTAGEK